MYSFIMMHIKIKEKKHLPFLSSSSNTEPPAAEQSTFMQSQIKSILPLDMLLHAWVQAAC